MLEKVFQISLLVPHQCDINWVNRALKASTCKSSMAMFRTSSRKKSLFSLLRDCKVYGSAPVVSVFCYRVTVVYICGMSLDAGRVQLVTLSHCPLAL